MGEAIFGLLGVVVGGLITAGSSYLLDRRRERGDREREGRSHDIEIKRAARLIDAELLHAQAAASLWIEKRRWWIADASPLATEAFQKYGGVIAPHLSDDAWLHLLVAVDAVEHIKIAHRWASETGVLDKDVSEKTAGEVMPMLSDVKQGRRDIAQLVWDVPPASLERARTFENVTADGQAGSTPVAE
jgi:hypothetical protein